MISVSSLPRCPDSPLWGLSPATRMRGFPILKRCFRSRSSTRNVRSRSSFLIALGTCASGRWVVASATRRPPPTSIITTCSARARSARYSVWPVNAMPASFITLFCTGAVTIAPNSPARQHIAAVGGIELAGNARPLEGNMLDARAARQDAAVADDDDARRQGFLCKQGADLRADPCGLARGHRNGGRRNSYLSSRRSST